MEIPRPFNFKLRGRAKEVFKMLDLIAKTVPMEWCVDEEWWELRLYMLIANRIMPGNWLKEIYEEGKILWSRK